MTKRATGVTEVQAHNARIDKLPQVMDVLRKVRNHHVQRHGTYALLNRPKVFGSLMEHHNEAGKDLTSPLTNNGLTEKARQHLADYLYQLESRIPLWETTLQNLAESFDAGSHHYDLELANDLGLNITAMQNMKRVETELLRRIKEGKPQAKTIERVLTEDYDLKSRLMKASA